MVKRQQKSNGNGQLLALLQACTTGEGTPSPTPLIPPGGIVPFSFAHFSRKSMK